MNKILLKYKNKLLILFALICSFSIGFYFSKYLSEIHTSKIINTIRPIRENNFNYKYIYPLLGYDFADTRPYFEDANLTQKIQNLVDVKIKSDKIINAGVYFRNFNSTTWAGVNQDLSMHPGSLLKVLIMIGYFKQNEIDPSIINKTLLYTKDINDQANFLPFALPTNLEIGKGYSISELLKAMIANSDNGAETLLITNIDRKILNDAYIDLNIPNPDSVTGEYTISPLQYVAFLRILYNSTYLNEKDSEMALSIMSKSTFEKGIKAGVDANIEVAQKYGERLNSEGNNIESIELHDCGIVYAKNPYSICIMTKGKNEQDLIETIKDVSKLIYEYQKNK